MYVANRKQRNIHFKAERYNLRAVFSETMSRCVLTMPMEREDILLVILQDGRICRFWQVFQITVLLTELYRYFHLWIAWEFVIHHTPLTFGTLFGYDDSVIRKPPRFVAVCIYRSFCILIFQLLISIRCTLSGFSLMTYFNFVDNRLVFNPGFFMPAFEETT